MSERVYVVRLTEEQHKQCFHGKQNSGAHYQLPDFLWSVLESGRPEHPERQGLLERLWESLSNNVGMMTIQEHGYLAIRFPKHSVEDDFLETVAKLRSLEAKEWYERRKDDAERQDALEELAALALLVSYTANDPNDEGQRRFREAAKRFRSLEAK